MTFSVHFIVGQDGHIYFGHRRLFANDLPIANDLPLCRIFKIWQPKAALPRRGPYLRLRKFIDMWRSGIISINHSYYGVVYLSYVNR